MPFAMFKGEHNIDDLVSRLFPSATTKAAAKQAAAALLKANPHLSNLSAVPAGSVLAVPETAPPLAPGEQIGAPAPAFNTAAARAVDVANALATQLRAIDIQARAAVQSLSDLAALPASADDKSLPDLSAIVPSTKTSAQKRLKDLDTSVKERETALTALVTQITALNNS